MGDKRKKVFFAGAEVRRFPTLVRVLERRFDRVPSLRGADYVVYVNINGPLGILIDRADDRSVSIGANPLGINNWNTGKGSAEWTVIRVNLGSLDPARQRDVGVWSPGRWDALSRRHKLPRADAWLSRSDDMDVVVLLPKMGGWLQMQTGTFVSRYGGICKDLARRHPRSRIVIRFHPRNQLRLHHRLLDVERQLRAALPRAAFDTSRSISEEQFARTKLAVSDWSTAVYQFVMRGIPAEEAGPGGRFRFEGKSPPQIMEELCQTVFDHNDAAGLEEFASRFLP